MYFINLEKIKNPQDVLFVGYGRDSKNGNKRLLTAILRDGTTIPITKPQGVLTCPIEPIAEFKNAVGSMYMDNFAPINLFGVIQYCVNKDYFERFSFKKSEKNSKFTEVNVIFNNKSKFHFCNIRERGLEQGKTQLLGLQKAIKQYQIEKNENELGK